jgi:hypothetical protein
MLCSDVPTVPTENAEREDVDPEEGIEDAAGGCASPSQTSALLFSFYRSEQSEQDNHPRVSLGFHVFRPAELGVGTRSEYSEQEVGTPSARR